MKKYIDINGNPIKGEMTVERMFDSTCHTLKYNIEHGCEFGSNPVLRKLVKESIKNRNEIIKTIKSSTTHKMSRMLDAPELHFIVLVEGKAVCLKSMIWGTSGENGCDQIYFVYEKTYNRFNCEDFQTDVLDGLGLDSVWADFPYEIINN